MNLDSNPTTQQLRELLAQCDDSAGNHVLWVTKAGEVKITRLPPSQAPQLFQHPQMQLRCETFLAGNEYVGPEAATDEEWNTELFELLTRKWDEAKGKSEVTSIGRF